jgi:hypothetical protein
MLASLVATRNERQVKSQIDSRFDGNDLNRGIDGKSKPLLKIGEILGGQDQLHVEQKVQYIAIFHNVVFALGAHFSGVFGALLAFVGEKVVEGDGLGADEAALKVGVNDACGLGGGVADVDGPGAHFFDAGGEIGLQTQEFEGGANEAVQAGFGLAHFL